MGPVGCYECLSGPESGLGESHGMDNFKLNLFQMKSAVNDVIEYDIMLVCWYASKHINSNNPILPV